jgi:hypothetical protein
MTVPLVINGTTYNYPSTNDELWGVEATAWSQAVTDQLAVSVTNGDISQQTLVSITNNQVAPANVTNLAFDSADIRAAFVEYYIYRVWNSGANEVVECGTLYVAFKDLANEWTITQVGQNIENAGVTIDITNGGQVTYTSDNKTPSTLYSGTMKFRARILQKT